MRIKSSAIHELYAIEATVDQFDGHPPVSVVELGIREPVTPDRLAVASALLFERWIAGPLEMPERVSPLTAQRIGQFFGERWVQCEPVRKGALPVARGHRVMGLRRTRDPAPRIGRDGDLTLESVSAFTGVSIHGQDASVATNVAMLRTSTVSQGLLADLGVAVAVAGFFDVNVMVFPALERADRALFDRATLLLESIGLGLDA